MPRHKIIPLEKSPLFRLGRKKDLASRVGVSLSTLKMAASDDQYREWTKTQAGKKPRVIEEPRPDLAAIQQKMHIFLRAVETPNWLMSGKQGVRPLDNALKHASCAYLINVDIEAFYQSTKREFVFTCFRDAFQMADDVASLAADIVTYKGHIPTGTATSQIVAFWAYKPTLIRIFNLSEANGIEMSVWVDDISFSSAKPFPKNWIGDVNAILREVDLRLKTRKTKKYGPSEHKSVTGSAITPQGEIRVMNAKRREILDLIGHRRVEELSLNEARRLQGKLVAQRQNEPAFFDSVYHRCKAHVRRLQKSEHSRT